MRTFRMCPNQWENVRFSYFLTASFVFDFLAFSCAEIASNNSNGNHLSIVISSATQIERKNGKEMPKWKRNACESWPWGKRHHAYRSLITFCWQSAFCVRCAHSSECGRTFAAASTHENHRTWEFQFSSQRFFMSNGNFFILIPELLPRRGAILRQQCHSSAMAREMKTNRLLNWRLLRDRSDWLKILDFMNDTNIKARDFPFSIFHRIEYSLYDSWLWKVELNGREVRRAAYPSGYRSRGTGEGQRNPASHLITGQFGTWVVAAVRVASNWKLFTH